MAASPGYLKRKILNGQIEEKSAEGREEGLKSLLFGQSQTYRSILCFHPFPATNIYPEGDKHWSTIARVSTTLQQFES